MSITCPVCYHVSYHPDDELHGYCGFCHAFTGVARFMSEGRIFFDGQQRPSSSRPEAEPDGTVQLSKDDEEPKAE